MKQYLDQQGVEYLWGKIKRNFANLSNNGKVPASQLPSYVDDVEEYGSLLSFPTQGEEGKIYVAKDTNLTYRWSGSTYVEIGQSIALGETSNTAYPGDKGRQLAEDLKAEVDRAKYEESDIRDAITTEKNRAEASERDNRSLIEKNTTILLKKLTIEQLETNLLHPASTLKRQLDRMQMMRKSLLDRKPMLQRRLKDRAKITSSELRLNRRRLEQKMRRDLSLTTSAMRLIELRLLNSRKLRADLMRTMLLKLC